MGKAVVVESMSFCQVRITIMKKNKTTGQLLRRYLNVRHHSPTVSCIVHNDRSCYKELEKLEVGILLYIVAIVMRKLIAKLNDNPLFD